jgi:protein PhnA
MNEAPHCPKCNSKYVYADSPLWICPECAYEWGQNESAAESLEEGNSSVVKDSSGNVLNDGDSVVVVKSLKVKGASKPIKIGTKVKSIRLQEGNDGHNIACKIEGFGSMNLKSEFVKKA